MKQNASNVSSAADCAGATHTQHAPLKYSHSLSYFTASLPRPLPSVVKIKIMTSLSAQMSAAAADDDCNGDCNSNSSCDCDVGSIYNCFRRRRSEHLTKLRPPRLNETEQAPKSECERLCGSTESKHTRAV